ncbi:Gfo/Idh/MocA family protein [Candidatus Binatus sp.]|uniref:Gfo/Idh/MocA family protein n=1 Tax=Candidatus Binatus sp. TaxID=2811406 RepID=UPI003C796EE8
MTTQLPASIRDLRQSWPRPSAPRPIVVIGAGSIVRDAHLPVYKRLGFPVAGIFDVNVNASRERAAAFAIPRVFESIDEAASMREVVFDVAIPPENIPDVIERLPVGAAVLIQKPMGRDLADARRIVAICSARKLRAAVNFQLRFAPNMLAVKDALARGVFGDVLDVEVRINLHTPWNYWAFLKRVPRLEVLMHSIHYLDLIRSLIGEPRGVYCKGVRHPAMPDYSDTRTSIVLDYGDTIRCSLTMNHAHTFGARYGMSQLKIEGTRTAAIAKMGVNLNYPAGEPDTLEIAREESNGWREIALRGSWFLEAFEGPMSNLQRFAAGEDPKLVSSVEDALRTMAVVEACYESSAHGATPIPSTP